MLFGEEKEEVKGQICVKDFSIIWRGVWCPEVTDSQKRNQMREALKEHLKRTADLRTLHMSPSLSSSEDNVVYKVVVSERRNQNISS